MQSIIDILIRRDGISENEAREICEQCRQDILHAIDKNYGIEEVEDILADWLGLEPDYLIDLMN
jgi:hypothetical protein